MFNLKLTDDNGNVSTFQVVHYTISLNPTGTEQVTISSQQIVTYTKGELTLKLDLSDGQSITYAIRTDGRAPDLNFIDTFVRQEINDAIANSWPIEISEYLERYYIYLGHETEENYGLKQFTAHKI